MHAWHQLSLGVEFELLIHDILNVIAHFRDIVFLFKYFDLRSVFIPQFHYALGHLHETVGTLSFVAVVILLRSRALTVFFAVGLRGSLRTENLHPVNLLAHL